MIDTITKINDTMNGIVWGWPALILLGFTGVLMTLLFIAIGVAVLGGLKRIAANAEKLVPFMLLPEDEVYRDTTNLSN